MFNVDRGWEFKRCLFSIVQEALDSPTFDKTICSVYAYLSYIKVIDLFVYIMNLLFCIVFCVVLSGSVKKGEEGREKGFWNSDSGWVGARGGRRKRAGRDKLDYFLPLSASISSKKMVRLREEWV